MTLLIHRPCRTCRQPVVFARKAEFSSLTKAQAKAQGVSVWACLEAEPTERSLVFDASGYRLLDGAIAWRLGHLSEVLQLRREMSAGDAHQTAIDDFPSHAIHHCEATL